MANRLTFSVPATQIDPQLISELEIAVDRLPSAAQSLLALLTADLAGPAQARPQASVSAAPMAAAPFVWREDGRPDWSVMWTSFCDLALYGGPPHRPEDESVRAIPESSLSYDGVDATPEIQRGIWETTNLVSESGEPGWLAVICRSARMAEWLCAAIALENVQARSVGNRLFVPASPVFTLESEVKSVITVVAKTVHYWEQHVAGV